MTDLLHLRQFERTMDDWANGQLGLEDAHDTLVRLGHCPEEADQLLRAHDSARFARQQAQFNGELAGVV